jgi:hypothetical protein
MAFQGHEQLLTSDGTSDVVGTFQPAALYPNLRRCFLEQRWRGRHGPSPRQEEKPGSA